MKLAALLIVAAGLGAAQVHPFSLAQEGEALADLELSSPGGDWGVPGHEAALARVSIDRSRVLHVMVFNGSRPHHYRVFLGRLPAGPHSVTVEREASGSAAGADLKMHSVVVTPAGPDPVFEHAPVLFARANTIGRFSDIPLLLYAERLNQAGQTTLQYTVIFSNEDGGTSTRDLMARWGRATDIEYIYRVRLDGSGATIQGRDHAELPYNGRYENRHPLLMPVTDNNMVAGDSSSPVRYQLAPLLVDLSSSSREQVMNDHPETWRAMGQELNRESKLRPYGQIDGEKISDPRNYLYVQYQARQRSGGLGVSVRLQGSPRSRSSTLGRSNLAIDRSEWVQTAVELPPDTKPAQISDLRFDCYQRSNPPPGAGAECEIVEIGGVFLLDADFRPQPPLWRAKPAVLLKAAESIAFPVRPQ